MSEIPGDLRYTPKHEWARLEGDIAAVGITDHAQAQLGEIIYVELPGVGTPCDAGTTIATLESVKAASDVYAPLAGEVVEVNDAVADDPSLINRSPYDRAWLVKIRVKDPAQFDALLAADAYADCTTE